MVEDFCFIVKVGAKKCCFFFFKVKFLAAFMSFDHLFPPVSEGIEPFLISS